MKKKTVITKVETLCLCRVSSDKQARDENIVSQKQLCLNFAKNNGFVIDRFYYEDGVSGWKNERPVFYEMLNYIRQNSKTTHFRVLFYDMSRLARNLSVYNDFERVVSEYGVEFLTVAAKYDKTPMGRFMCGMDVLRARLFSDELSQKTRESMRALMLMGYYQFNAPPGLKRARDEHKQIILVRDEPIATLIATAFEKYASGELPTKHAVAEYFKAKGWSKGVMNDTKAASILSNEIYTGIFAYEPWDIERQAWKIDNLVSPELFNAVQARDKGYARQPYKSDISAEFPLRNEICCEHCGQPLTGYFASNPKGVKYGYYRCFNKNCDMYKRSIPRDMVHKAFLECISEINMPSNIVELFMQHLHVACSRKDSDINALRAKLEQELVDKDCALAQFGTLVARAAAKGDDAMVAIYEQQMQDTVAQKQELQARLEQATPFGATEKFRTAIARGREFFECPAILWKNGNLVQRKRLVRLIFNGRATYDRDKGFRTASMRQIFNKKSAQTDGISNLAAPTRFELVFSP